MKKTLALIIITVFCTVSISAQNFSTLWEGHFSYLNIKDVVSGNNKIYAASENAVFSYDTQTFQIETISTINGLSGEVISTIHFSERNGLLLVGYENGLMDVFSEQTEDVTTVVDILDKQTIPPDNKRINHFREFNDLVYIATDFGISVYDLSRLEFGDTYFIGAGGSQIKVNQTEIFGDYIYAVCENNEGVKRGLLSSTNLIDFQEWEQITTGNYGGIEALNSRLYCTAVTNNGIYEINGTALSLLFNYPASVTDIKSSSTHLIATIQNRVYVYDENFNLIANPVVVSEFDTEFTSAVTVANDVYIGTQNFGVLKAELSNISDFEEIHPDGPLKNNVFSVEAGFGQLWASYGDFTEFYNPSPVRQYGISRLYEGVWNNVPYDSVFGLRNLNDIAINPNSPQQAFVSSFQDGMLVLNNGEPELRLDETNSALESLFLASAPAFRSIRVSGLEFDDNGLLWSITSLIEQPLKSFNPDSNQWRSYDFTDLIPDPILDNLGFEELTVAPSGTIFVASFSHGVIGFNENGGSPQLKSLSEDKNLPNKTVRAIALDSRQQLWIGTDDGLRVVYNTSGFFDDDVQAEEIVILDNGIPKELLAEQFISDIKVDGSNNKWVGTIGSGLFYFSSDGQETIYHFTTANSPLPSNNINDISLDTDNGVVYIATDRGLVAFRSGGSAPTDELSEAFVYPNPVRPEFDAVEKKIKIKDITDNVNIKITDIEGNLVVEAQSRTNLRHRGYNLEIDGGTAYWNGKNFAGNKVASGVYLIMLSDMDTLETKVLKLMVVR